MRWRFPLHIWLFEALSFGASRFSAAAIPQEVPREDFLMISSVFTVCIRAFLAAERSVSIRGKRRFPCFSGKNPPWGSPAVWLPPKTLRPRELQTITRIPPSYLAVRGVFRFGPAALLTPLNTSRALTVANSAAAWPLQILETRSLWSQKHRGRGRRIPGGFVKDAPNHSGGFWQCGGGPPGAEMGATPV